MMRSPLSPAALLIGSLLLLARVQAFGIDTRTSTSSLSIGTYTRRTFPFSSVKTRQWQRSRRPSQAARTSRLGLVSRSSEALADLVSPSSSFSSTAPAVAGANDTMTVSSSSVLSADVYQPPQDGSVAVLEDDASSSLLYRQGLLTIGFCTLVFASLSPVLKLASQQVPVVLINAQVSVLAFLFVWLGGPLLNQFLPNEPLQNDDTLEQTLPASTPSTTLRAGAELGLWQFCGTVANLYGLSWTTADHGAFLIQLTTLFVPLAQGLMGVPIPRRIQASVALALSGVVLFCQDAAGATVADTLQQQQALGDFLCVIAAVFYATYDLRLYQWGRQIAPRPLMMGKLATQASLSLALLGVVLGWEAVGDWLTNRPDVWSSGSTLGLIVWSGFMVNALVPFLQVRGQQIIGPTRSQTVYASQPLWAALMSFVALGETVGPTGLVGGTAFCAALVLAATTEPPKGRNEA